MKHTESLAIRSIDDAFRKDYPISATGALFVPLVFRNIFGDEPGIPNPKLAGMRPFASYSGFGYGTLRTMLARWKKESLIEIAGSEEPGRYRLGSLMETMTHTRGKRPTDLRFNILVFSFASENARERYRMQQILKHFGFRRFAQNAYANVNFDEAGFRKILREEGMEDKAFLFSQAENDDKDMAKRLIALWSPEKIGKALERFALRLNEYLEDAPPEDEAIFCRYFFAGTSYYERFTSRLPNIPESRISDNAPLSRIENYLQEFKVRHEKRLIRYFTEINK